MYFKYTYSLRTFPQQQAAVETVVLLSEMLFSNVTCLYTSYCYTSYPDVIKQRLCSCFRFSAQGNLWMRELQKFQRALWFCFWCWWEIIWVLIDTKVLILHLVTMIWQKKTYLLFITHSEYLSPDKRQWWRFRMCRQWHRTANRYFFKTWFNQFFARG